MKEERWPVVTDWRKLINFKRQLISDALDESYAAIDFGPEESDSSSQVSDVDQRPLDVVEAVNKEGLMKESEGIVEAINEMKPEIVTFNALKSPSPLNNEPTPETSLDWTFKLPEPPSGFKDPESMGQQPSNDENRIDSPEMAALKRTESPESETSIGYNTASSRNSSSKDSCKDSGAEFAHASSASSESGSDTSDPLTVDHDSDFVKREEPEKIMPVLHGPMQFSINSYTERSFKEVPYEEKLVKSDSFREGSPVPKMPSMSDVTNLHASSVAKANSFNTLPKRNSMTLRAPNEVIRTVSDPSTSTNSLPRSQKFEDIVRRAIAPPDVQIIEAEEHPKIVKPPSVEVVRPLIQEATVETDIADFNTRKAAFETKAKEVVTVIETKKALFEPANVQRNSSFNNIDPVLRKPSFNGDSKSSLNGDVPKFPKPSVPTKPKPVSTASAPWIIRKTSLQSVRVTPNDDLVLNQRRGAKTSLQQPMFRMFHLNTKASSMGNLNRAGLETVELKEDDVDSNKEASSSFAHGSADTIHRKPIGKSLSNLSHPTQDDDSSRIEDLKHGEQPNEMLHSELTHPRLYQYNGPPSIQLATWGDRNSGNFHGIKDDNDFRRNSDQAASRSKMPERVRKSIADLVVPSRMEGYHSLQQINNNNEDPEKHVPVKDYIRTMENKNRHMSAKPWSPPDPKSAILAASRRPSATSNEARPDDARPEPRPKDEPRPEPRPEPKDETLRKSSAPPKLESSKPPQFYFGEPVSAKSFEAAEKRQTAIDKVKTNEALTHPIKMETSPSVSVAEKTRHGRHTSVITVKEGATDEKTRTKDEQKPERTRPKAERTPSSDKQRSSPTSSSSSAYSSSSSSYSDFKVPRPKTSQRKSIIPSREKTQDEMKRAFEAELLAGKSRLRGVPPVVENGVGGRVIDAVPPTGEAAPPPPPIPAAPRMPKVAPVVSKSLGGSQVSARDQLMMAIRSKGGVDGLRKTSSGKNL